MMDRGESVGYHMWASFYELMCVSDHPVVRLLSDQRRRAAMASAVSRTPYPERISHLNAWMSGDTVKIFDLTGGGDDAIRPLTAKPSAPVFPALSTSYVGHSHVSPERRRREGRQNRTGTASRRASAQERPAEKTRYMTNNSKVRKSNKSGASEYHLVPTQYPKGHGGVYWTSSASRVNPRDVPNRVDISKIIGMTKRKMTEGYLNTRMNRYNSVETNQNYVTRVMENPRTPESTAEPLSNV